LTQTRDQSSSVFLAHSNH